MEVYLSSAFSWLRKRNNPCFPADIERMAAHVEHRRGRDRSALSGDGRGSIMIRSRTVLLGIEGNAGLNVRMPGKSGCGTVGVLWRNLLLQQSYPLRGSLQEV